MYKGVINMQRTLKNITRLIEALEQNATQVANMMREKGNGVYADKLDHEAHAYSIVLDAISSDERLEKYAKILNVKEV